jgi:hypothetical protein
VVALVLHGGRAAESFVAAIAVNRPERFPGFVAWEPTTFMIDSVSEIDVGLDGETLRMQPPLRFTVRPAVLRIRRPTSATRQAPTLRELSLRSTLRVVWRAALGRPAREPLALA